MCLTLEKSSTPLQRKSKNKENVEEFYMTDVDIPQSRLVSTNLKGYKLQASYQLHKKKENIAEFLLCRLMRAEEDNNKFS